MDFTEFNEQGLEEHFRKESDFDIGLLDASRKEIETKFKEKQGVFVTLNKNGQLRGCIGYPQPIMPLYKAVINAARAAAFEDPRFPAVRKDELKEISFELSVLTVPELIEAKPEEYTK